MADRIVDSDSNGVRNSESSISTNNLDSVIATTIDDSSFENESEGQLRPCGGALGKFLVSLRNYFKNIYSNYRKYIKVMMKVLGLLLLITYIVFLVRNFVKSEIHCDWCTGYGMAFILIGLTTVVISYNFFGQRLNQVVPNQVFRMNQVGPNFATSARYIISGTVLFLFAAYAIYQAISSKEPMRLVSFCGIFLFIICGALFSKHPEHIRWDTVLTGFALQVCMGLISIPVKFGRDVFKCFGDSVVSFLEHGYVGAAFAYGDFLVKQEHIFAFQSLSVLYFLSMIVYVLFYLGWLQKACMAVGKCIHTILGTTVIESVNSIATVFLGQSEAPLLYGAYIKYLTRSEIHACMTACFATVAGTMLAAYTTLGIDPKNVITASMMAAPGALAYAKLYYPEANKSVTSQNIKLIKSEDGSIMDAACKGTVVAVAIVAAIIASVIACVSLVDFLDAITVWLGSLIGIDSCKLETILGYMFIPLAYVMGVESSQCRQVASLIGIKTMANELLAYKQLGEYKNKGLISPRSEVIATFSLCGFANPSSLATLIALLSSLAPNKREAIVSVAVRALIAGSITSFSSACIAGILTPENGFDP